MKQLAHEPDARRYVLSIDAQPVAVLDYAVNGNQISFRHTFTQPPYRGNGLAAELVEFAVDDVERNSTYRIIPMCWYVADWFTAHRERASLLTRPL